FLGLTIILVAPFIIFFTADAMNTLKKTSSSLSSNTQVMAHKMLKVFLVQCTGALVCYMVPLAVMLSTMIIDCTFIPGWFFAPLRIFLL
ncbi:hypothetical protein PMAYCL1PPCAC_26193, partial [Pristionchus mayeri]